MSWSAMTTTAVSRRGAGADALGCPPVGGPVRLAVDLGTCHTVAVVQRAGQPPRPLLFDGSPLLASGVFAARDGVLHTGRDAERLSLVEPARFEPHPKRRVDEGAVLLGDAAVPVPALLGAILRRVAHEAWQAGVDASDATVLTYPADWGQQRRGVLKEAARLAGIGNALLVDEPVAAGRYCMDVLHQQVPPGRSLVIFDFGGGTLDLAVVRREPDGPTSADWQPLRQAARLYVLATGGLDDLGGLDVDAALVGHLGQLIGLRDADLWRRLSSPNDTVDLRERGTFWDEVRGAKEMLSRGTSAPVQLPRTVEALHLTRDELERVAGPLVDRAVDETRRLLQRSGLSREDLAGIFLVGGSSRIPLVATRLHARFGIAPTVPEQPELPVAFGALLATAVARPVEQVSEDWGAPAVPAPTRAPPPPTGTPPTAAPSRGRLLVVVLAAAVALALVGAGLWFTLGRQGAAAPRAGSSGAANAPSGTGGGTAVPAGFVACGPALCPGTSTCFGGEVTIGGVAQRIARADCGQPHYWEEFAAGYLPADAKDVRQDSLITRADIAGVCSAQRMADRSRDPTGTKGWEIDAWPVQVGATWVYYCLARPPGGGEWTGSKFRPGG
jgi:molecular chaperone HscA